eukprot:CAMPEP_0197619698 /NCGR_PEP_ID=MMETSP1338-20131121/683_1 /TAXON_ID=43686 ORGANISM="Pelagodinium beii, Strain RCC1491" /NCGR_SAMPLE_ID=MMETSP1338 /ASSEMBLY_ACC=CAM_ASM_000754 /LENGTH=801 /DNA_ID=CAMNT_0043188711 /DNA_START=73 /DNA_END=2475 /DNA_ORIENTATION=-
MQICLFGLVVLLSSFRQSLGLDTEVLITPSAAVEAEVESHHGASAKLMRLHSQRGNTQHPRRQRKVGTAMQAELQASPDNKSAPPNRTMAKALHLPPLKRCFELPGYNLGAPKHDPAGTWIRGVETFKDCQASCTPFSRGNLASLGVATMLKGIADREHPVHNGNDGSMASFVDSKVSKNPWWQVDLGTRMSIGKLVLENRADACKSVLFSGDECGQSVKESSKATGAVLGISNEPPCGSEKGCKGQVCGKIQKLKEDAQSYTVDCRGKIGKYVYIILPGSKRKLTFHELEIYQASMAQNLKASSSGAFQNSVADHGNDGKTSTGVTTLQQKNPWWQVVLPEKRSVGGVILHNRPDQCASQLFAGEKCTHEYPAGAFAKSDQGALVGVSNKSCHTRTEQEKAERTACSGQICGHITRSNLPQTGHRYEVDCFGATGKYVWVELPGAHRVLNFQELEVYPPAQATDLAWNGKATLSSADDDKGVQCSADHALEGRLKPSTGCLLTEAEKNPWWQVDLGRNVRVGRIVLDNVKGKCASRFFNGHSCSHEYLKGDFDGDDQGARVGVALKPFTSANISTKDTYPESCGVISESNKKGEGHRYGIDCRGAVGRYVYVWLPGDRRVLNLERIEVYQEGCRQAIFKNSGTKKTCLNYAGYNTWETIHSGSASTVSSAICNPPRGIPGLPGQVGRDGTDGPVGPSGRVGAPGVPGRSGPGGTDGSHGTSGTPGTANLDGEAEKADDYITNRDVAISSVFFVLLTAIAFYVVDKRVKELASFATPQDDSLKPDGAKKKEEEQIEEEDAG